MLPGLNYRLQKSGSKISVVAFIIMPAATHSYTIDALKGQAVTKQLRDTVTEIQNRIGQRLFEHAMSSNGYVNSELIPRSRPDISNHVQRARDTPHAGCPLVR